MRKLIISILVLGMATSVQAAIELSVNGVYDGPGNITEILAVPGDYFVIDMAADEGYDFTAYLIIEGDPPGLGEWGDNLGPPYAGLNTGYYFEDSGYPALGPGAGEDSGIDRYEEAGWGYGYVVSDTQFSGVNPGGTVAEFLFHCASIGDVVITLWDAGGGYVTPDDTIVIHIPEPATICLFGFGALSLLRRKRRT